MGYSKRNDADVQYAAASRIEKRFAGETPHQQAKHREIAQRYGDSRQQDRLLLNLRKRDLQKLFFHRYGERRLPDDDAGRGDLRVMVDHLLLLGEIYVFWWARVWAPWMSESELIELITLRGKGRWWKPQELANEMCLDSAVRLLLDIRTIRAVDRTTEQLVGDRATRKAAAEAARRLKNGATPRELSEARQRPWIALGVSESTYRREKRKNRSRDSNSCSISLQSLCGTNYCHGAPPPTGGSSARAVRTLPELDRAFSAKRLSERVTPLPRVRTPLPLTVASSM